MPQRQESEEKMNNDKEMVMYLQGKAVREMANRLIAGNFKIEKEAINRYRVYEAPINNVPEPVFLIDRRSFVLLDKEIFRLQAKDNPLAAAITTSLDNNVLELHVSKKRIDLMPAKLICKTFSFAKVIPESVKLSESKVNYIIKLALIPSVSERALTEREKEIVAMFQRANANAAAGNTETEMQALPVPETVDTTAKTVEVIPAKK